jgi:hypothetical protein
MKEIERKFEKKEFVDEKYWHEHTPSYEENTHNIGNVFGLGDFVVFNTMILLILQPEWSLTIRMLVVFGCIISIQVGHRGSIFFQQLWSLNFSPAIPCPVITFSMYTIILDVIMR